LSAYDAGVLVADRDAATLFEATVEADASLAAKSVANWVTGEYLRLRNAASGGDPIDVAPTELAALVRLVDDGGISRGNAKETLAAHATTGAPVASIVADRGFRQISDTGVVGSAVDEVLAANPNAVADYKAGKTQAVGFLVGQVMKSTRGQADAGVVQALVRERLDG
jgi:aspartyl-tRNA(Asn)/glutamyl-tRNA(Gln) amidotransferase subunit B